MCGCGSKASKKVSTQKNIDLYLFVTGRDRHAFTEDIFDSTFVGPE
jgi:hypothetical protein